MSQILYPLFATLIVPDKYDGLLWEYLAVFLPCFITPLKYDLLDLVMHRIKLFILIVLIIRPLFPVMVFAIIITDGSGVIFFFLRSKGGWKWKVLKGRSDTKIFIVFNMGKSFRTSKCRRKHQTWSGGKDKVKCDTGWGAETEQVKNWN